MNIELIRREIMGLAFTYDSCARILYKEKLRADLFEDYKKMYIDLMEHCGESHNEFNCIEYAVLNPIVSELMFECKSSHSNFEKLLNTFKALSFKNKLEMNINKANSILTDDSNKSILEAYKIVRQDIDLYKEEGKSESFSDMSSRYDYETKREFLDLGYPSLENLNVEPTDFILIGARPSMGKTAFLINLLKTIKKQGMLLSLEMSNEQIMDRIVSYMSGGVEMEKIIKATLNDKEKEKVKEALKRISSWKSKVKDDSGFHIDDVLNNMKKAVKDGAKFIMIDYIQLIRGNNSNNRNLEISNISIALKEFAKTNRVPVFALTQLSRSNETRSDKRPQLSDLRDSGSLEQDADKVILLHRESYYKKDMEDDPTLELIIPKNRQGAVGTKYLNFFRNIQLICERIK